jgi:hypothetical protein
MNFKNIALGENPTPDQLAVLDDAISFELASAGLWLRHSYAIQRAHGEVPYAWVAEVDLPSGPVRFTRSWRYWRVQGKIHLALAQKVYAKEGNGIRAGGHGYNQPPEEHVEHFLPDGRAIVTYASLKEFEMFQSLWDNLAHDRVVYFSIPKGCEYVTMYHIDSQEGLNRFVEVLLESVE